MAPLQWAFLLVLVACSAVPGHASRPMSPAAGSKAASRQAAPGVELPPTPTVISRVIFDPNRREDNKVEDYIGNVYLGIVEVAEADPAAAATGAAVSAGRQRRG